MKKNYRNRSKWVKACAAAAVLSLSAAISAFAATGKISFSDPSAEVGSEVNVTMKIAADDGAVLSDANITLNYDNSKLEFIDGTDADGGAGTIRVHGTSNGGGTSELQYNLKFKVLAEGQATIGINQDENVVEVYDGSAQPVELSHIGQSTINIAAAEGTGETETAETSSEAESGAADGNGETAAESESGASEAENLGIQLSARSKTITLMNPGSDVQLPEGFKAITIMVDGQKVQGWAWGADQDPKYCVVYGMNDQGELNFYRYDMAEKTIQRYFEDPLAADSVSNQEYSKLAAEYEQMRRDYELRFVVICVLGVLLVILGATVAYLAARLSASRREAEKPRRKRADWNEAGESEAGAYDLYDENMLRHDYEEAPAEQAVAPIDETQILKRPEAPAEGMEDTMPIPDVAQKAQAGEDASGTQTRAAAADRTDAEKEEEDEDDGFDTFDI